MLQEFDPNVLSTIIDDGIWKPSDDFAMKLMILEDNMMPEFKHLLQRYPINIFMENEHNFVDLLENHKSYFKEKYQKELVIEYYKELCLNLPGIYLLLGRLKDLENILDCISAICETGKPYEVTFAKLKLLQASVGMKYKTHFTHMDIENAGNIMHRQDQKLQEGFLEYTFLTSIKLINDWKTHVETENRME